MPEKIKFRESKEELQLENYCCFNFMQLKHAKYAYT